MTGIPEYLRGDVENLVTILLRMGDSEVNRLRVDLRECTREITRERVRAGVRSGDPFDSFVGMAFFLVSAEDDHRRDTLAAMEEDMVGDV